jgi:hypothetical protein
MEPANVFLIVRVDPDGKDDAAFFSEFYGIAEQVDDYLLHPRDVADDLGRQAGVVFNDELDRLLPDANIYHGRDIMDHRPDIVYLRHELHCAGLDLRKV